MKTHKKKQRVTSVDNCPISRWIFRIFHFQSILGIFHKKTSQDLYLSEFLKPGLSNAKQRNPSAEDAFPQTAKPSWQVGSSLKRRQLEWEPIASCVESVGHEPLVRVPCKESCLRKGLQRSEDHSPEDLGRKIHGATTAAIGRAVRGRKAVGKTSRAEAQAETRGTRHGVCDCSFGWAHPESWKEAGATQSWLSFHLWETPGSPSSQISMDKLCFFLIHFCVRQFFLDSLSSTEGIKNNMYSWGKGHCFG